MKKGDFSVFFKYDKSSFCFSSSQLKLFLIHIGIIIK